MKVVKKKPIFKERGGGEGFQEVHGTAKNDKTLHGQFEKATKERRKKATKNWLKGDFVNGETESTIRTVTRSG